MAITTRTSERACAGAGRGPTAWRVLIVDEACQRASALRQAVLAHGMARAEIAAGADEALDLLGAYGQGFDVLLMRGPLADGESVDLMGVLRRLRSPLRVACLTDYRCGEYPRPGRLAGITAVIHEEAPEAILPHVDLIEVDGLSVRQIVDERRTPRHMTAAWAEAIYGVPAGSRLAAPLD